MQILILGNGISGITAAIEIRKRADFSITVVSDESDYFFSRTALMYVYMGHLRFTDTQPYEPWFWSENRIKLVRARIVGVDFERRELLTNGNETLCYDRLVLATGSKTQRFDWPGQDLDGVHGLYHKQDLEALERHSKGLKRAVIAGGGLIGIEMAEMLRSRHIPVSFLVREHSFWNRILPAEESAMVNRHIREHGIDLRPDTEINAILADGQGKCCAVLTSAGERIPCEYTGIATGVTPNIDLFRNTVLETGRGILVDAQLRTNIEGVYAIGDCAEIRNPTPGRQAIEAVWYAGRMMGETVAAVICGENAVYNPGIWFNSAKFLDIEYQIYGEIAAILPPGIRSLYWEHPNGRHSIRLNYESETGAVVGFNLLGVRYRQAVCIAWIQQRTPVETVLEQLGAANFDPEFYPQYEKEIIARYNRQSGRNLNLRRKRSLSNALAIFGKH